MEICGDEEGDEAIVVQKSQRGVKPVCKRSCWVKVVEYREMIEPVQTKRKQWIACSKSGHGNIHLKILPAPPAIVYKLQGLDEI